jgi:hypothetical protein
MKHIPNVLTSLRSLCATLLWLCQYTAYDSIVILICVSPIFWMAAGEKIPRCSKADLIGYIADYTLLMSRS